jgi:hypothetical protein
MKIRLRVRTSPTESFEWQHAGPRIQIGKEDCQLAFHGEQGVSRRHAEIELSPTAALVRDSGSTNGTYVNGERLAGSTRLKVGDEVALGMGGPRLDVLALDLAAVVPESKPAPAPTVPAAQRVPAETHAQRGLGFGAVALVAAAAVIGGVLVWIRTSKNDATDAQISTTAAAADDAVKPETSAPHEVEQPAPAAIAQSAPPPAPAPAPSPLPTVPPPLARPIEEVVQSQEAAIVWIGYELDGKLFPYASGWAVRPNSIVTTAETARQLKVIVDKSSSGEFGPATLVARDVNGTIPIRELRLHSAYDATQPAASESVGHNVAVAILDGELKAVCPLATQADLSQINAQTTLLAAGYIDESTTREPFDKIKNLVRLERKRTRVTASDPPGSDRPLSFQLHVGETGTVSGPLENMAGSPVFNEQGRVVGVLAILGSSFRMSSLESVRDWLAAMGP